MENEVQKTDGGATKLKSELKSGRIELRRVKKSWRDSSDACNVIPVEFSK